MKYSILAASLIAMASSQAAVTLYAEYHLGEAGSLLGAGQIPQDSSGNARHLTNEIDGANTSVLTSGVSAPGSSAYISTATVGTANQGWYGSGTFTTLALDDFAFGIYVRAAANTTANQGDVATTGGGVGGFKLSLAANGWAASADNVAWIGNADGTSGSFTADTWAHLAVIRSGGTSTFYINGVAQAGTSNATPVHDTPLLSMIAGNIGEAAFDGHIDEFRVVTFTAGETTANIMGALTIPEPSSALLGALGMLALLRRRR